MKKTLLILVAVLMIVAIGWVWLPMQREYNRIQGEVLTESLATPVTTATESAASAEEITDVAPETPALSPAQAARVAALAVGEWRLRTVTDVAGDLLEVRQPEAFTLRFSTAGQVSGQTDCNNFSGRYDLTDADGISMGPFAMTKMACPDTQEQLFIDVVTAASSQIILPSGELALRDDSTGAVVTLELINLPPENDAEEENQSTSTNPSVEAASSITQ